MTLHEITGKMIEEITFVQSRIDENEIHSFLQAILQARRIVLHGAGRMGLVTRTFAMRLKQLGLEAYVLGETTTPSVGPQDLLILNSSSGETRTVLEVARIGKGSGVRLAVVTSFPQSSIARLADITVTLPQGFPPGQGEKPLKTASEQNLFILLDAVAVLIMQHTGQTADDIWKRHSNLE